MNKNRTSSAAGCIGVISAVFAPAISIGAVIAVILSYGTNKSIFWATAHGLLGWFYVIYHAIYK